MKITSLLETYKAERLEFSLALYLSYQPIVNGISMLSEAYQGLNISPQLGTLVRVVLLAAVAVSLLRSITLIVERLRLDVFIVALILILLFSIAWLDPIKARIIRDQNMLVLAFLECLPAYVMCRVIADWRALWSWLKKINYIVFTLYILAFILVNVGSTYRYRTFASGVTLSSLIFMIEWAYVDNQLAVTPMAVSLFLVVTCGRRSSVVLLLMAYGLICYYKKKYKQIVVGVLVGLVILLFGQQILTFSYDFISSFGVRPRNLYRLVAGTVGDDSGRFDRWGAILKVVDSSIHNQLLGMGLVSDRVILMDYLMFTTDKALYPHGIIVELIAHYGYLVGLGVFFWLFIVTPLRGARLQEGRPSFTCVFILTYSMSLALLFQGSYLQDKYFFMLLGLAVWLRLMRRSPDAVREELAASQQTDSPPHDVVALPESKHLKVSSASSIQVTERV